VLHAPYEQEESSAILAERQRLARELHDSVSQALYGIHLCARNAREALEADPQQAIVPLEHIIHFAEQGMAEIQAMLCDLRADLLQTDGLIGVLSKQVAVLRSCYQLNIEAELEAEPAVGLEIKHALYRIGQEALHNAAKHAHARTVILRLTTTQREVALEVRDDGQGFDMARPMPGHFGLLSMRERATRLNGSLSIESEPRQGTCIRVRIPSSNANDLLVIGRAVS
jgi:signal transduction histidine kinase